MRSTSGEILAKGSHENTVLRQWETPQPIAWLHWYLRFDVRVEGYLSFACRPYGLGGARTYNLMTPHDHLLIRKARLSLTINKSIDRRFCYWSLQWSLRRTNMCHWQRRCCRYRCISIITIVRREARENTWIASSDVLFGVIQRVHATSCVPRTRYRQLDAASAISAMDEFRQWGCITGQSCARCRQISHRRPACLPTPRGRGCPCTALLFPPDCDPELHLRLVVARLGCQSLDFSPFELSSETSSSDINQYSCIFKGSRCIRARTMLF